MKAFQVGLFFAAFSVLLAFGQALPFEVSFNIFVFDIDLKF
jgi:hypothetical protein